jgi:hypothetical protein
MNVNIGITDSQQRKSKGQPPANSRDYARLEDARASADLTRFTDDIVPERFQIAGWPQYTSLRASVGTRHERCRRAAHA